MNTPLIFYPPSTGGGGAGSINVSAGTTSNNLTALTFDDAGGVSFGLNGSVITANAPAGGGGITNIKVSAGTLSTNRSDITFANSNGISFGLQTNGVITGTVATNYLTTARASNDGIGLNTAQTNVTWTVNSNGISLNAGAYLTTARASNDAIGLNTAQTNVTWTVNSSGISINAGAYLTTAALSNHSHNLATTTTNGSLIVVATTNSAGATFAVPAFITTARASNDAVGLNTAQTNVTWTVNSSGISLNAGGYAGTGTSATNASVTLNSNGLAISVAAPGGGGGSVNFSAGTTSNNLASVTFGNAGGVTFGLNAGTITASAPAAAAANNTHTIIGNTAFDASTATFQNGNINFLVAGNMIAGFSTGTPNSLVLYAIPQAAESIFYRPNDKVTTVGAPINASLSVIYCPIDHPLTATRFDAMASVNVATTTNNSSAGVLYSITAVIYTRTGATLNSVSSGTTATQMTWTSNATGSVTGAFYLSVPMNINITTADKYWVGVQLSTRATGLTGAATTSLANTVSMFGVGSAIAGAFSIREPGATTNNSLGWFEGFGMYSGTSNYSSIALSNMTQQGTNYNRANIAFRMKNI